MSDPERFAVAFVDGSSTSGRLRARIARLLFGDRVGLAVFLAACCLFTVCWITAWRINDTLTLLNTLHGMGQGELHMVSAAYGDSLTAPGSHTVGDRVFGRNYGILTLSLVPLVVFEALAVVADLRIAIAGGFSLVVLALAVLVGRIVRRPRQGALVGSVLALLAFVGNVLVATDLDPARTELYALQVTHLVAAAFVVVLSYRLLAAIHGRRAGLLAGALVALAIPTGLWATIPKRHVFTALLTVFLAYVLYRSRVREAETPGSGLTYRAGGYAAIGLFAWVHAPEALLLLVIFAAVDLPTAPHDLRSLATLALSLAVATVPFLVTNYLVSGSPVRSPRMLPLYGAPTGEPTLGGGGGGGGGGGTVSGRGLLDAAFGLLDSVLGPMLALVGVFQESVDNLLTRPAEILTIFLRSGYVDAFAERANYEAVNLAVVESAPILAATLGVVPAAIVRYRNRAESDRWWPPSPERTVDAFLALLAMAFSLFYLSRLPVHAQITVRYLLPVYPALVLLIVRLPVIRGVLAHHWRLLLWTYAVAVLIGGQLVVVVLVALEPGVGEAFQFHAWLGLVISVPLAVWALLGRADGWSGRVGAILVALATAAITVFLGLVALEYFTISNEQALPLVRTIADVVSFT